MELNISIPQCAQVGDVQGKGQFERDSKMDYDLGKISPSNPTTREGCGCQGRYTSCPTHGTRELLSTLGCLWDGSSKRLRVGWKHNASTPFCNTFLWGKESKQTIHHLTQHVCAPCQQGQHCARCWRGQDTLHTASAGLP